MTARHVRAEPVSSALVIGDVHGCADELEALLKLVADPGRPVFFVGDLVSKGPAPELVLAQLRDVQGLSARGNHDERYLDLHAHYQTAGVWPEHREQHRLPRLSEEDWRTLSSLPHALTVPIAGEAHDTVIVHAGLVPGIPLAAQAPEHLMTLRSLRDDGTPSKEVEGTPWAAHWNGPGRVVFGHDAVRGLQRTGTAVGLDTGCVYGKALTGLLLPEDDLVSVPAKQAYQPIR